MVNFPLRGIKFYNKMVFLRVNINLWSRKNNKTRPLKSKNSARTTYENLENNFQKVKKTTLLTLKIVKIDSLRKPKFDYKF